MKTIKLDIAHTPAQSLAAYRERKRHTFLYVHHSFHLTEYHHTQTHRERTHRMPTLTHAAAYMILLHFSCRIHIADYTWVHPTGAYPATLYVKQCYTNDQSHQTFWVMMCTQLFRFDFLNRQNEKKTRKVAWTSLPPESHPVKFVRCRCTI